MINTVSFVTTTDDCDERVVFNFMEDIIPNVLDETDEKNCTNKPEPSLRDSLPKNICELDNIKTEQECEPFPNEIQDDNNEPEIEIKPNVLEVPEPSKSSVQLDIKTTNGSESKNRCLKELYVKLDKCNFAVSHKKELQSFLIHLRQKWFDCYKCSFGTTKRTYIKKHILTRHEAPFDEFKTCEECGYKTRLKHPWKCHLKEHRRHGSLQKFSCPKCSFVTDKNSSLKEHLLRMHGKRFEKEKMCDICGYKTMLNHNWVKHQARHKKPGYPCEFCDKKYTDKVGHDRHVLDHHYEENLKGILSYAVYKCELCTFRTLDRGAFDEHLRCKHLKENDKYQCNYCGYETGVKRYLRKHIRRHQRAMKTHSCDECGKIYTDRKSWNYHNLKYHKDNQDLIKSIKNKTYPCKYCGLIFFKQSRLNAHINCKHEGFLCEFCNERFDSKFAYHEHLVKEHYSKDIKKIVSRNIYQCDRCDYKTVFHNSYKSHIKDHVRPKIKKIYECEICDFRANCAQERYKHVYNSHSNGSMLKCEHCDKVYKGRVSLEDHYLKIHKDDPKITSQITLEILSCNLCSFKTVSKGSLIRHLGIKQHMSVSK